MSYEFETYPDSAKQYRWRLWAPNSRIIAASSEGYASRSGADAGRDLLRTGSGSYEVYQDAAGHWRWRFKATNGLTIATAGEAYSSKQNAESARDLVKAVAPVATIRPA